MIKEDQEFWSFYENNEEKFEKTKKFLLDVWSFKNCRPAFVFEVEPKHNSTFLERIKNPRLMLDYQMSYIKQRAEIRDDFLPALWPYIGTGIFPSAFGCKCKYFQDREPWAEPIIFGDPKAVYKLKKADVYDGLLGDVLNMEKFFMKETKGRIPIRITDIESPLGVAVQIWNQLDFYTALYNSPGEVNFLLERIIELMIKFIWKFREIAGELLFIPDWPSVWMPKDLGVCVADDVMANISAEHFAKFSLPYLNRISDEFGGLWIHSCGNISHNLDNLLLVHNLRGIDFAVTETPIDVVLDRFRGKVIISMRVGLNSKGEFLNMPQFVRYVLKKLKKKVEGVFLYIEIWEGNRAVPVKCSLEQIDEIYKLLNNIK